MPSLDPAEPRGRAQTVRLPVGDVTLEGDLVLPRGATSLVIFAHGSGSSRHSPRNREVATTLNDAGIGTLLFDLLTRAEERVDRATLSLRFDIPRLAERVVGAVDWAATSPRTRHLPIGLFGASTGAAAALCAAADRPSRVHAVVSRGGRPDLADDALRRVRAPALFLVGGRDVTVVELNRAAVRRMSVPARIEIIAGATHLFEEPGALEEVASRVASFFRGILAAPTADVDAAPSTRPLTGRQGRAH